ncbi:MAG: sigma-70 family RNA polymerase sigma factor [Pirellulales bacterium]|nr:sigma-70 family RNA polymerase sigma factor [Pirellulales bacterium]
MQPWPETSDSLIVRLQNPADRQAWDDFASLYEPLIFRFARRSGLQYADAEDITQRVLWSVARAADRWEPGAGRGRFRSWLATVTRNAVINMIQRECHLRGTGLSAVWEQLQETPQVSEDLSQAWIHERQLALFRHAAQQVKGRCAEDSWQAFWMTAVQGHNADEVATALGKSIGAVYAARSRILSKIRKVVASIEKTESKS